MFAVRRLRRIAAGDGGRELPFDEMQYTQNGAIVKGKDFGGPGCGESGGGRRKAFDL